MPGKLSISEPEESMSDDSATNNSNRFDELEYDSYLHDVTACD